MLIFKKIILGRKREELNIDTLRINYEGLKHTYGNVNIQVFGIQPSQSVFSEGGLKGQGSNLSRYNSMTTYHPPIQLNAGRPVQQATQEFVSGTLIY